jgi:hypothetical protein
VHLVEGADRPREVLEGGLADDQVEGSGVERLALRIAVPVAMYRVGRYDTTRYSARVKSESQSTAIARTA